MLKGKNIVLGISGGIAAYKSANLASMLVKQHANVHVLMTKNATEFIQPVTFEALTGNRPYVSVFDRGHTCDIEHIRLAHSADLVLIAPASADIIAKLYAGIADDMLTSMILACKPHVPKLVAPAMNTYMYENTVTQRNINGLKELGFTIIEPDSGRLACGDVGRGKMPSEETLLQHVLYHAACEKDLKGKKVLVSGGATREAIDPVRFITNHSSGKMGYAIAKAAMLRGADVTFVSGVTDLPALPFVNNVEIVSAAEMFEAISAVSAEQDIIIKAAAVADYRPAAVSYSKIKKTGDNLSIDLERTVDILGWLGEHRRDEQYICGFAMETENTIANAKNKLKRKHVDMIAANCLREAGAGFGVDTNILTLITADEEIPLPLMSKEDAAHALLDRILVNIR